MRCPPLLLKYLRILCGVPTLVLTSSQIFQIELVSPDLILKHLISLVVNLAQLLSPSVALPAELVWTYFDPIGTYLDLYGRIWRYGPTWTYLGLN